LSGFGERVKVTSLAKMVLGTVSLKTITFWIAEILVVKKKKVVSISACHQLLKICVRKDSVNLTEIVPAPKTVSSVRKEYVFIVATLVSLFSGM
jgi:hypothetical protein